MANIIGVGSVSLTDLNDAWSSSQPPQNPSSGSVWIDLSVMPAMIKRWNGSTWVDIGELDPDLSETISNIHSTLGNMANDNKIDFNERQIIKDRVSEIIGSVIGNNASLPSVSFLDSNESGSFYSVRRSALNAGLATSTPEYIDVATRYNNLRAYLNGLNPIKPWNTSNSNKDIVIDVVKDTFRDFWLQYFIAVEKLSTMTAEKLKTNVDDIDIGGANLITHNPDNWEYLGNNRYRLSQRYPLESGVEYAIKNHSTVSVSSRYGLYREGGSREVGFSADGSVFNSENFNQFNVLIEYGGNDFYEQIGDKIKFKLERGNKHTDWTNFEGDTEDKIESVIGRIADVEFLVEEDSIIMKVISSQIYLDDRMEDLNASQGYTNTKFNEARQYTDSKVGNLIDNPSLTNSVGRWTVSNGYQINIDSQDFFGEDLPVLRNFNNAESNGAQVYSNWFDVNPTKMYEVSIWIKSSTPSNNAGSTYFGLNARDGNGSSIGVEEVDIADGSITDSNDINFYFWREENTENLEDWVRVVGFILPAGFDLDNAIDITDVSESSARMKSTTRQMRIRWLNYYNYGTSRTVWVANPKAIELSSEVATTVQRKLLLSRLNSVEQDITPEGISTVIEESSFYEEYRNSLEEKVDLENLGDYIGREELDDFSEDVDGRISDAMSVIDLEPYATKLELDEQSTNITAKFSASGGGNLLKNSIGYAGFLEWNEIYANSFSNISTLSNLEMDALGFGSGFNFIDAGVSKGIYQDIAVIPNMPITISWYINKRNAGGSEYRLSFQVQEDGSTKYTHTDNRDVITNGYEHDYFTYTPESSNIRLRIVGYSKVEATVTGIMANIGDTPLRWSLAVGESYNTNVRMDMQGVRVSQIEDGREVGYTQMSTDEFAGYYVDGDGNYEKIFYLNKDETVTKKVRAKDEITMGSIKVVNVESGGYSGWAFVPISE